GPAEASVASRTAVAPEEQWHEPAAIIQPAVGEARRMTGPAEASVASRTAVAPEEQWHEPAAIIQPAVGEARRMARRASGAESMAQRPAQPTDVPPVANGASKPVAKVILSHEGLRRSPSPSGHRQNSDDNPILGQVDESLVEARARLKKSGPGPMPKWLRDLDSESSGTGGA
ncbi:hypothetical protein, partial [Martelella alba]|uniref:hypothetical protein n=1 Tax=Martelella alba TaxID=2590451 RepID=UPI001E636679